MVREKIEKRSLLRTAAGYMVREFLNLTLGDWKPRDCPRAAQERGFFASFQSKWWRFEQEKRQWESKAQVR